MTGTPPGFGGQHRKLLPDSQVRLELVAVGIGVGVGVGTGIGEGIGIDVGTGLGRDTERKFPEGTLFYSGDPSFLHGGFDGI